MIPPPPTSTLFPYTTLFRSARKALTALESGAGAAVAAGSDTVDLATLETAVAQAAVRYDRQGDQHYDVASALIKSIRGSDVDRKSTRLNSSHANISYAVFCL